jgi:hypothetical protein
VNTQTGASSPGPSSRAGDDGENKVRTWRVFDRPWSDDDTARYIRRNDNSVLLSSRKAGDFSSLDFLTTLPGLRHLEIDAPIRDDSLAFQTADLFSLTLFTASKRKFDLTRLVSLRNLALRARPGLEAVGGVATLQSLMVGGYSGPDLAFLGSQPQLRSLRLDCRYSALSLHGIERCASLSELSVRDAIVESLAPLRALNALEELEIVGVPDRPSPTVWDLNDLVHLSKLTTLRLPSCGPVASLLPLRQIESLQKLTIPTDVQDGNLFSTS